MQPYLRRINCVIGRWHKIHKLRPEPIYLLLDIDNFRRVAQQDKSPGVDRWRPIMKGRLFNRVADHALERITHFARRSPSLGYDVQDGAAYAYVTAELQAGKRFGRRESSISTSGQPQTSHEEPRVRVTFDRRGVACTAGPPDRQILRNGGSRLARLRAWTLTTIEAREVPCGIAELILVLDVVIERTGFVMDTIHELWDLSPPFIEELTKSKHLV